MRPSASDPAAVAEHRLAGGPRSSSTWPLHRRQIRLLLLAYLGLTAFFVAVGWSIADGPLRGSVIVRADDRVKEWPIGHRTPLWNSVTWWGSALAEGVVKTAFTLLVCIVLVRSTGRWLEAVVTAVPLVLEEAVFLTVTVIVGRRRPDVPRLDGSPVDSSFPSGHAAAATVYLAMVVVLFWHTRRWWARGIAVLFGGAVPVIVGAARIYRGMHYLSDVIAGVVLGAASVVAVVWIVRSADQAGSAASSAPPLGA
jgi:membrane-associated phospholipid phosphatase